MVAKRIRSPFQSPPNAGQVQQLEKLREGAQGAKQAGKLCYLFYRYSQKKLYIEPSDSHRLPALGARGGGFFEVGRRYELQFGRRLSKCKLMSRGSFEECNLRKVVLQADPAIRRAASRRRRPRTLQARETANCAGDSAATPHEGVCDLKCAGDETESRSVHKSQLGVEAARDNSSSKYLESIAEQMGCRVSTVYTALRNSPSPVLGAAPAAAETSPPLLPRSGHIILGEELESVMCRPPRIKDQRFTNRFIKNQGMKVRRSSRVYDCLWHLDLLYVFREIFHPDAPASATFASETFQVSGRIFQLILTNSEDDSVAKIRVKMQAMPGDVPGAYFGHVRFALLARADSSGCFDINARSDPRSGESYTALFLDQQLDGVYHFDTNFMPWNQLVSIEEERVQAREGYEQEGRVLVGMILEEVGGSGQSPFRRDLRLFLNTLRQPRYLARKVAVALHLREDRALQLEQDDGIVQPQGVQVIAS